MSKLSFDDARTVMYCIANELRQVDVVSGAWLEWPNYVSVKFDDATTPLEFTLGFAEIDAETENPIANSLLVQAMTDDGVCMGSAWFDFVPNDPKANAWNFLECALGSSFFDDIETENN